VPPDVEEDEIEVLEVKSVVDGNKSNMKDESSQCAAELGKDGSLVEESSEARKTSLLAAAEGQGMIAASLNLV